MSITAVNTLEVRIAEETDQRFEWRLKGFAARFEQAEGCISYTVIRCNTEPGLWVLSGYWTNHSTMVVHFDSQAMTELLNHLLVARANLTFASFTPWVAGVEHDGA
ncbi:hypothetical protein ALP58_02777 [Pseudomonas savastanoi]|uniref:ABM domain-containing protein n=2 Tax=Pseudomonas syringae group TaxID=136849 RepID=A0A0P9SLN2_PSESX|nr:MULTISPECIES: antibiotic biosynthesis monooxygenase [Pseudomonas syringae group]KPW99346.1 Uncharacterized protein ALO79_01628 [Pseudomonas syringae pv. castaneae]RMS96432.1 hypothetical protein ALP58_02777 [Pseudomonas savastanoi]